MTGDKRMNTKHSHRRERTGPLWWVSSVVTWVLLFALCAVIVVTIVIPIVTGSQRFTILTGSMRPTYQPGTLIIVKPVDEGDLTVGMPITYQLESGQPTVVTHRIISMSINTKGERTFITQGDANNTPDEKPVRPVQIRGKVWYSVPYLGHVNSWLTGDQRKIILTVTVGTLGVYAMYMIASGTRESMRSRNKNRSEPQGSAPDDSADTANPETTRSTKDGVHHGGQ